LQVVEAAAAKTLVAAAVLVVIELQLGFQ